MILALTEDGTGPPLVLLHGLFGAGQNWGAIRRALAPRYRVLTPDLRNHGASPRAAAMDYPTMAGDIAETLDAAGEAGAAVLGHSMGGKAAMQLALTHGELIDRLVVADIAPVAYGHSQSHLVRAMRGLDLRDLSARSEADRRLAAAVGDAGVRAFLLQSLDLKADTPVWRLNLDVLEREMDRITGWPGTEGRFEGPALFLAGALSDYVRPEHRERIKHLFPNAKFARIPGAGHWLHAERPREFEAALRTFLERPSGG